MQGWIQDFLKGKANDNHGYAATARGRVWEGLNSRAVWVGCVPSVGLPLPVQCGRGVCPSRAEHYRAFAIMSSIAYTSYAGCVDSF